MSVLQTHKDGLHEKYLKFILKRLEKWTATDLLLSIFEGLERTTTLVQKIRGNILKTQNTFKYITMNMESYWMNTLLLS